MTSDDVRWSADYPTPYDNECGDCGHEWRSRGIPSACPECAATMPDDGTCTDVLAGARGLEPEVGMDAIDDLQRDMESRLSSETRGPSALDELVEEVQEAEREGWWKERRTYDTSGEPEYGYKRGRYWQVQRKKAIERDQSRCQDCGLSRMHHQEYYGHDFVVHHIIPEREFDSEISAHTLENLITICTRHHMQIERMDRDELIHRTDHHDWTGSHE